MNPKDQIHYDIAELLEKIAHLNIKLAGADKMHPVELDLLKSYLREIEKLGESLPLLQLPKPTFPPQQPVTQTSSLGGFNTPKETQAPVPPIQEPIAQAKAYPAPTWQPHPINKEYEREPAVESRPEETVSATEPENAPIAETQPVEAVGIEEPVPAIEEEPKHTFSWESDPSEAKEEEVTPEAEEYEELTDPEEDFSTFEEGPTQPEAEQEETEPEPDEEVIVWGTLQETEKIEEPALERTFTEPEPFTEAEPELVAKTAPEPTIADEEPEEEEFKWERPTYHAAPAEPELVTEATPETGEETTPESVAETTPEPLAPHYPIWAAEPTAEPEAQLEEEAIAFIEPIEEAPIAEIPTAEPATAPSFFAEPVKQEAAETNEEPVKRSLNDLFHRSEPADLGSRFQFQQRRNLREMIDLSERYVFTKELFAGDADYYDRAIRQLNQFETLAEAQTYLNNDLRPKYNWAGKEQVEKQFTKIVERRFA